MKKYACIGNCQMSAISDILKTNIHFFNNYKDLSCEKPIHLIDAEEFESYVNKVVIDLDLLVIQPISNHFRNNSFFSTEYIIGKCKYECVVICIPSCYFEFYYTDFQYVHTENERIKNPIDYHSSYILQNKDITVKNYVNFINQSDEEQKKKIIDISEKSLSELKMRYMEMKNYQKLKTLIMYFVNICDFIRENFRKTLLFYTCNHPTKFLFHYIVKEILVFIGIHTEFNKEIDPLDWLQLPLYKNVKELVSFTTKNDIYILSEFQNFFTIEDYAEYCIDHYKQIELYEFFRLQTVFKKTDKV
jgi:hypothetical protein